jgi:hypothetical protein
LDSHFIDNPKLSYGRVGDVITDLTLIEEMAYLLGTDEAIMDWRLFKIFHTFNTKITSIEGRLGFPVKAPPLWATLVLEIPDTSGVQIKDPIAVDSALAVISRQRIQYTHPNFIATFPSPPPPPTDEFYSQQESMFSPLFGVNMELAWDILDNAGWNNDLYGDGIDIALFDTGVRFQHEDLRCSDCPGINPIDGGEPSIVIDALTFDDLSFPIDLSMEPADVQDNPGSATQGLGGHGTRTAGVLSAIRNNQQGIAGITSNMDHTVNLHSYRVIDPSDQGGAAATNVANAIGFILNCQGDFDQDYDCAARPQLDISCYEIALVIGDQPATISLSQVEMIREVVELMYDAQFIQTAARGNSGNDAEIFPASYEDRWLISVGASGTDGEIVIEDDNDDGDGYGSSFGDDMDVTAPGVTSITHSSSSESNSAYAGYAGSSGALPNVTGVGAMLMTHHPKPLAQEDIEHLIEYTATDVSLAGYDDENGWGRLNAGAALNFIDPNGEDFRVIHVEIDGGIVTDDDPFGCGSNCILGLDRPENDFGSADDAQLYSGKIIKYSHAFAIDLTAYGLTPPPSFINGDPNKLPFWTRSSATGLWFTPDIDSQSLHKFMPDNHLFFEGTPQFNGNILEGVISGYAIEISDFFLGTGLGVPITCNGDCTKIATPSNPININECYYGAPRLSFSFLAKNPINEVDPIVITDVEDVALSQKDNQLFVFPNPASGSIQIEITPAHSQNGLLQILNAQGKIMAEYPVQLQTDIKEQIAIDLNDYADGLYIARLTVFNSSTTAKFVKQ